MANRFGSAGIDRPDAPPLSPPRRLQHLIGLNHRIQSRLSAAVAAIPIWVDFLVP
jgi:hypothetical protein